MKDTLYKFWVLKVKLRDRSGGGGGAGGAGSNSNVIGNATSVLRGGRTFDQVQTAVPGTTSAP